MLIKQQRKNRSYLKHSFCLYIYTVKNSCKFTWKFNSKMMFSSNNSKLLLFTVHYGKTCSLRVAWSTNNSMSLLFNRIIPYFFPQREQGGIFDYLHEVSLQLFMIVFASLEITYYFKILHLKHQMTRLLFKSDVSIIGKGVIERLRNRLYELRVIRHR